MYKVELGEERMAAGETRSFAGRLQPLGAEYGNLGAPLRPSYRPSVDGLRAWAVGAVVLYHVGVPGVSGGFIGVDVFFVISGFLITSQLILAQRSSFHTVLLEFYSRRVRRILPSLTVVAMATLALGWMFLLPTGEQQDLSKSAIASALFVSNIFFWLLGQNYLAGALELQPLLHTWSLSVEEQFYLLWPLLLLILWAVERQLRIQSSHLIIATVFVLSTISFALSVSWATTNPHAAFYLTPSRVWELGAGAALALLLQGNDMRAFPASLAYFGLAAIVASVVAYDRHTPFPGAAAALPIAGTVMVIIANVREGPSVLNKLLTSAPIVTTGKISYSWYLWHWPLLAIARAQDLGERNLLRDSIIAGLSYVIAFLSTRYLETPIRQQRVAPFATATGSVLTGLGAIAVFCVLPVALWVSARAEYRTSYALLRPETFECTEPYLNHKLTPAAPCILAQGHRGTLFLIGDSFADHWSSAIGAWAKEAGVSAIERVFSACNIIVAAQGDGYAVNYDSACLAFSKQVIEEIRQAAESGESVGVVASGVWRRSDEELRPPLSAAVGALERIGVRVLLIGPSPFFPFLVPSCLARRAETSCRLPRAQFDTDSDAINRTLMLVAAANVRVWNPASQFCDTTWCYPSHNGVPSFSDGAHISRQAALRAKADLAPDLSWLLRD
jgi:peptidoglycan/LPS O-acetylase OafA/YrhL